VLTLDALARPSGTFLMVAMDQALETEHAEAVWVSRGSTVLVPSPPAAPPCAGRCRAVACRPPA
jgi:hypothetical protein